MVILKTKSQKHTNDDEKRRKSIKDKERTKLNQSQIIKQALLCSSLNNSTSKKIIFSDNEEDLNNSKHIETNKKRKTALFDDESSEDESYEIKEKPQFNTKKGFKLLELQSSYRNDERFKIDERFLEKDIDEDIDADKEKKKETAEADNEKITQLKVLESILGKEVTSFENLQKVKKRHFDMVRYDTSIKEHEKYEIKAKSNVDKPTLTEKKKNKKKKEISVKQESKPFVSQEKFFKVSKEIKEAFKKKNKGNTQFSILQIYANDDVEMAENEKKEANHVKPSKKMELCGKEDICISDNEEIQSFKKNKEESSEELEQKPSEKVAVAKGIWKESFFLVSDDPRFKEGFEFINKKFTKEASEGANNYGKIRRNLKEILRLHMKKQLHNKDPFKNKVGGMNKKQMANLKVKNFKTNHRKIKQKERHTDFASISHRLKENCLKAQAELQQKNHQEKSSVN